MLGTVSLPNIPSSNSLVVKDAEMLPATTSSLGSSGTMGAMSPMDSAFAIFSEMRDILERIAFNTDQTVENVKTLVIGNLKEDQLENRRESIKRGETDEPKEKGPGVLSKVGGALQSINPFSEKFGFGLIGKAVLAGAGLLGLNLFGDKLVDPIANLLETIKTGKVGTTISDTIEKIKTELTPYWEDIKVQVGLFIDNVKMVYESIVGTVKVLKDYVMQFDKDGDGKLDEAETKLLKEDVVTRLSDAVGAVLGNIVTTLVKAFTIYTVGSIALKSLMGRSLLMGAPALAAGAGGLTLGLGIAAMAAVVAAGVWKLADNSITAYEDAVTDELGNQQDFNAKEFFTRLLVGKETGNKMADVINNAYDKMLIGAGTGSMIGAVSGAGIFSLPGAALGGIIGALSGITLGALTAYYGDEAVEKVIDDMVGKESPLGMIADYIVNMYQKLLLAPFEFIFGKFGVEGDSFFSKMGAQYDQMSGKPLTSEDIMGSLAVNQKVADAMPEESKIDKIKENDLKLEELNNSNYTLSGDQQHTRRRLLAENALMKKSMENKYGVDYETLERYNFNLAPHAGEIDNFKSSGVNIMFDDYVAKKLSDMGMKLQPANVNLGGANATPGMIVANNKNQSDNVAVTEVNAGGFTVGNQDTETQYLIASGLGRN